MMSSSVETKTTSNKIRVLDKMNAEKIPYLLINMVVSKDKKTKDMNCIETGWNTKSYEFLMETYNNKRSKNPSFYNAIFINLKKSPYMVADCDTEDGARRSKFNNKYGKCWRTKSCRKGLPHVWFKKHEDDKNGTKIGIEPEIDLVYEGIFENIDACFGNTKREMKTFDDFPTKTVIVPKKKKIVITSPKQIEETNFKIDTISNEEHEIMNNIDAKYINNYGDWLKIIWGIYNKFENYILCDWISQKGDNYKDYADVVKHVNDDKKKDITWGTVCYYSRKSNEEKYIEIKTKYVVKLGATDELLSNAFLKLASDDIVYSNENVYVYDKEWKMDKKCYALKKKIRQVLNNLLTRKISSIDQSDPDKAAELNETYAKILAKVQGKKTIDNVADMTIQTIANSNNEIVFDLSKEQLYNLHFKNGCYELKTKTFRKRDKLDYVTKFLQWDYNPVRNDKNIAIVELFFRKLHGDEIGRKFAIEWLASCLDGSLSKNKFKLNVGYSAENGKSTEFAIHISVFDIYSEKHPANLFALDNAKAHKEFIHYQFKPIRFAFIEELRTTKLDIDRIKEYCDGRIKCEILYGTSVIIQHQATLNACGNRDSNIAEIDKGIIRRGTQQFYTSSFSQYNTEDNYETNSYKPDKYFVDQFDRDDMKNAYLHFLLDHYKENMEIPKQFCDNFEDVTTEQDTFTECFNEVFVKSCDNDKVSKKVFIERMAETGCNIKEWRVLLSNMKSRGFTYDRNKRVSGSPKGCFIGIRLKYDYN